MRTVVIDDEELALSRFQRLAKRVEGLEVVGVFTDAHAALNFIRENNVEMVCTDVEMPGMNGVSFARTLRMFRPDIILVFITAFRDYLGVSNELGCDYYLLKPYSVGTLEMLVERMSLLQGRLRKRVSVFTFGGFDVVVDGAPLKLTGKMREILALVASRQGKEISNEEIFYQVWPGREYDRTNTVVYYNALRRLKKALEEADAADLLMSTRRGQMLNVAFAECDFANLPADDPLRRRPVMPEYNWDE